MDLSGPSIDVKLKERKKESFLLLFVNLPNFMARKERGRETERTK